MTSSMTGYGSAEGTLSLSDGRTAGWRWEFKGVNAKGLEVKLRLPSGFDTLEQKVRPLIAGKVSRGTIHAGLSLDLPGSGAQLMVDEDALDVILKAIGDIRLRMECDPPRPDTILGLKGILTTGESEEKEEDRQALEAGILKSLEAALAEFTAARGVEGKQLAEVLAAQIANMTAGVEEAKSLAGTALPHHLEQMRARIRDLIGEGIAEERTEQEAVLLAVKSDIREELDRLDGHLATVRDHLSAGGVIGRKLDFLAQEIGREVNTLTSKAWTLDIKRIGLDLKLLVDQFREQVQNIE